MSAHVQDFRSAPERVASLPMSDRREIIAQSLAAVMGADCGRIHPLAHDMARFGRVEQKDLIAALGVKGSTGLFTSGDLMESVRQSLLLLTRPPADAAPPEHWGICGQIIAADLRAIDAPQLTEAWAFDIDAELSEVPATTMHVRGEAISVRTLGAIGFVSRAAVINCQWDLVASMTRELIDAVQRRERSMVVDVLTNNPVMADGTALFAESRGNLLAEVRDSNESVGELFAAFRNLKGTNGEHLTPPLGAVAIPSDWVVPAMVLRANILPGITIFDDPRLTSVTVLPPPQLHPVIGLARMGPRPEIAVKKMLDDRWGIRVMDWTGAAAISARAVQAPAALGAA